MKIDIVPVVETVVAVCPLENKSAKPISITSQSTTFDLDKIFAEFLEL